jgi:DNA-binding HxlR family transcriptional regulator
MTAEEQKQHEDALAHIYVITELISKKWVLLIMHVIAAGGETRFSEIEEQLPDINPAILSDRLSELEKKGLVERIVTKTKPVSIHYQMTEKADDLIRVFHPLAEWAQKWGNE